MKTTLVSSCAAVSPLQRPGNAENLVDDLGSRQVGLESEPPRRAEIAIHLASRLGRDAKRGAVAVGDVDALYVATGADVEEIFHRAVDGFHPRCRLLSPRDVVGGEPFPVFLGDVDHLVEITHFFLIQPFGELTAHELRHSAGKGHFCQPVVCQPDQGEFIV